MAHEIYKRPGLVERTSADYGDGHWKPGMKLVGGFLWAAPIEGLPTMKFETKSGEEVFGATSHRIISVRNFGAKMNMILELELLLEDSTIFVTLVAPRGRLKKILAYVGHPV